MRYLTQGSDEPGDVRSVRPGYYFPCPDIGAVDAHLAELHGYLGARSNLTALVKAQIRQDIDRLLERRLFLTVVEGATAA
jgi:hypothetical protein